MYKIFLNPVCCALIITTSEVYSVGYSTWISIRKMLSLFISLCLIYIVLGLLSILFNKLSSLSLFFVEFQVKGAGIIM